MKMPNENEKQQPQQMSAETFFASLSDAQKLELINAMIATMHPDFRQHLINQLAGMNAAAGGEVQLNISSDDQNVRLDFGKALAWFIIPKAHALQLGQLLMQHAGAVLERIEKPPINVKPM